MTEKTEGRRIYAIGDIHGLRDDVCTMLERIRADLRARPHDQPLVITLGDYGDRGPDSRGVTEELIALKDSPLPSECLIGNHDDYILNCLYGPEPSVTMMHWLLPPIGGSATLASYGVIPGDRPDPEIVLRDFKATFPPAHAEFLTSCKTWYPVGGYMFVHAGIRPGVPMEQQDREDLTWIREPFLSSGKDFGFKVVHGHTIVAEPQHHRNRIAIDTGAVKGGKLSCLVLEGNDAMLLEEEGLTPFPEGSGVPPGGLERLRSFLVRGSR